MYNGPMLRVNSEKLDDMPTDKHPRGGVGTYLPDTNLEAQIGQVILYMLREPGLVEQEVNAVEVTVGFDLVVRESLGF